MTSITNALPDIPRLYTGICEWAACLVYATAVPRRSSSLRTTVALGIGLPVMIAVQYIAGALPLTLWIFGMLAAAFSMLGIIHYSDTRSFAESLYITARAFVLAELVASLHWQLATFIAPTHTVSDSWELAFLLIATYAGCFLLAWLLERRNFASGNLHTLAATPTATSLIIMVVTFAMSNLSFVSTNTPFSGTVDQEVFYIRTLVDCCGFVVLYAQQEQAQHLAARAELDSINTQLTSQHQEYLQSKANIETLARISHDLKHQITALRAQVDPERREQGFIQLEAAVQRYSDQHHSGNPVLDVMLTTKARLCAEEHIVLTTVADGKLLDGMSSLDIASLFGNALDNAIEAAMRVQEIDHRLIKLALYQQGQFTVMRVENYYVKPLERDHAGNLRTTKHIKPEQHGYGVKSIRHIAEQYGGEVSIHTEDHWFTLTVVFPSINASA